MVTEKDKKEKIKLEEEYNKYLNSHSGQAYRCMSFREWKHKREIGDY
jgi:hypothetical protein